MTYDTLQYVDANGATQEVALKLANLSGNGGAVSLTFTPRSHAPSEFRITWAQPPETGIAIPFKSRCKVYANRSSSLGLPNTFSGGTCIFQGRRWDNEGTASASRVMSSVTLLDAWKDLEKVTYAIPWQYISGGTLASPTYSTFYWPDIVLFQPTPGVTYSPAAAGAITTWQQMQDIIRYAASYAAGDDAVQIQLAGAGVLTGSVWSAGTGAEFTPVYLNWYPVRSAKCAEVLNICLRPHPGVYSEIDYSTTPPTLHFRNRANLTAVTLPYKSTDAAGIVHVASEIQSLDELVPDNVRLFYKINGTFNGQPVVNYSSDTYPTSTNKLLSLDFSIDITGASQTETRYAFTSAAFDPTSLTLWRKKIPALKQISEGGQVPNDGGTGALAFVDSAAYNSSTHPKGIQVIDDTGATIDYSSGNYEFITENDIFTWMTLSSGAAVAARYATVKAFFSYDKVSAIGSGSVTDKMQEHAHHFRVLLTNAPSATYVLRQTVNTGENIPANLAQAIYTELATLQWKLRHDIIQVAADESTLPTLIKPGKHKVNLSGGADPWTTMNAVPENVSIRFFRDGANRLVAQHSISCGPVNHLEPGYLIQLTNLFCNRNRSGIDASQRISGTIASSQVNLSNNPPRENSTSAEPVPVTTNHVYVAGGVITGQIQHSAKDIADILATGATPVPIGTDAEMRTRREREITVCDAVTGAPFNIIVCCTEGHTRS